jgi:hypothetical protein
MIREPSMNASLLLGLSLSISPAQSPVDDDLVIRWNEAALLAIKAEKTPPPIASRHLAILHIAIFDSVNSIRRTHRPFEVEAKTEGDTSQIAAAGGAAHRILTTFYPNRSREFDQLLAESVPGDTEAIERGLNLGRYVGREILRWRSEDGHDREVRFKNGTEPGEWAPTPPAFAKPFGPHWPKVTCFALVRGFQLRTGGPPKLPEKAYTDAFEEVKRLGSKNSKARTAEQTEIAKFWADGEGTVTPPGRWNRIAQSVSRRKGLNLPENARLFALLNVAMADVGIACWDCKYHFNFWRPIQGIREADRDGNPDTAPDREWEPLLITPPFPSYTSGHSSFSGAAATILADVFGKDAIAFETASDGLPDVKRKFTGFWAAAEEAGISRIYGGIHWQFDNTDGLAGGKKVATIVLENRLRPYRR